MVTALHSLVTKYKRFPGGSSGKELTSNVGAVSSIPRSGRSTGRGNGNPFQYSCLENPMNRGTRCLTAHVSQRVRHDWTDLACMHTVKYKNIHEWKLLNKINFASEITPSWFCEDCWRRSLRGCGGWFTQEQDPGNQRLLIHLPHPWNIWVTHHSHTRIGFKDTALRE